MLAERFATPFFPLKLASGGTDFVPCCDVEGINVADVINSSFLELPSVSEN
jgi:hypothetical protein